jgi:hypothetical protein
MKPASVRVVGRPANSPTGAAEASFVVLASGSPPHDHESGFAGNLNRNLVATQKSRAEPFWKGLFHLSWPLP